MNIYINRTDCEFVTQTIIIVQIYIKNSLLHRLLYPEWGENFLLDSAWGEESLLDQDGPGVEKEGSTEKSQLFSFTLPYGFVM